MNHKNKAFTLIELLVVIAIIAILAAILFPVFAQAKAAAKKTATLNNIKEIGLAAYLYANDYDDNLGDMPAYNEQVESYVLAVRMAPYIKSNAMWLNNQSPYQNVGSMQHGVVDLAISTGQVVYMKAPDDPCVGVGKSTYTNGSPYKYTDATSNYYKDIYPPVDFMVNGLMWSYNNGGCPTGGLTNGYTHPGPNLVSGINGPQNGTGQAGVTMTSVAKCVLALDAPSDNQYSRGGASNALAAQFWGANYQGEDGQGLNAVFFDSHAKYYSQAALEPTGWNAHDDAWTSFDNPSSQYFSAQQAANAGKAWVFWGTSDADPAHQ
jgi:prepilin-type N-terminal cleavage/methylation domain-containing protein